MNAVRRVLQVHAGPRARKHLRERGLQPTDVRVIAAAAGGPKGLILNPLDRFVFGHWLADAAQEVHLLGASIGAWRMACACAADADTALAEMAQDYVRQRYDHAPGRAPTADHVSEVFGRLLGLRLGERADHLLAHPTRRLHVFTSRGRGLLARESRWQTPVGYLAAFGANLVNRQAMAWLLERVVFSDPRTAIPLPLADYPGRNVALDGRNMATAVLASCSIPFWLRAVHDIPGGPPGAYWDGGITDYHLHLDYAAMSEGLVLYPHFQRQLVPGWLDKALKHRHRATPKLDNVVVLSPTPEWVASLPRGKLPDRSDFKTFGDDFDARVRSWSQAVAMSAQLADEFAALCQRDSIDAAAL